MTRRSPKVPGHEPWISLRTDPRLGRIHEDKASAFLGSGPPTVIALAKQTIAKPGHDRIAKVTQRSGNPAQKPSPHPPNTAELIQDAEDGVRTKAQARAVKQHDRG